MAAATFVLNGDTLGLPGAVLFAMFLGDAVLGTLALARYFRQPGTVTAPVVEPGP